VEKHPKVHPPAPSKGGDSPRSNFTLKFELYIYLVIDKIQIIKNRCSVIILKK